MLLISYESVKKWVDARSESLLQTSVRRDTGLVTLSLGKTVSGRYQVVLGGVEMMSSRDVGDAVAAFNLQLSHGKSTVLVADIRNLERGHRILYESYCVESKSNRFWVQLVFSLDGRAEVLASGKSIYTGLDIGKAVSMYNDALGADGSERHVA